MLTNKMKLAREERKISKSENLIELVMNLLIGKIC